MCVRNHLSNRALILTCDSTSINCCQGEREEEESWQIQDHFPDIPPLPPHKVPSESEVSAYFLPSAVEKICTYL